MVNRAQQLCGGKPNVRCRVTHLYDPFARCRGRMTPEGVILKRRSSVHSSRMDQTDWLSKTSNTDRCTLDRSERMSTSRRHSFL